MIHGMQPPNYPSVTGGVAFLAPVALSPAAGLASAGGIPFVRIANVAKPQQTHPWMVRGPHAASVPVPKHNDIDTREAFKADFQAISTEGDPSAESGFGTFLPSPVDVDSVDVIESQLATAIYDAPRVAQPVLCAASLETLYVCASPQHVNTRNAMMNERNHPVVMPDGRGERAQVCRDIVSGSLLGTEGRNATMPFDPTRADVTKTVADTARRWTGKASLVGKKEWSLACLVHESPGNFITKANDRLHAGTRLLPSMASTEWMIRVGMADGLPMHQALVRSDLPRSVGLGTVEWAKLALGIEQLGEQHWDLRHTEVMDAAVMPATNTKAFTGLATSMATVAPHIATQRLRNQLTMLGVPTMPAEITSETPPAA